MITATPKNIRIYLESNPNPNSLKFVVSEMLIPEGMSFDFPDPAATTEAPLAQELFMYPFVERVFYMSNFITVTKKTDVEWLEIQNTLKDHIKNFLEGCCIERMRAHRPINTRIQKGQHDRPF